MSDNIIVLSERRARRERWKGDVEARLGCPVIGHAFRDDNLPDYDPASVASVIKFAYALSLRFGD
jgi:hypothetical protein